jgi:hypothetical protein
MAGQTDDLHQAKLAAAALDACIVQTLNESDPTFEPRFLDRLGREYEKYRNNSDADPVHVLDAIHWTGELLKGWNPVPKQAAPRMREVLENAPDPSVQPALPPAAD